MSFVERHPDDRSPFSLFSGPPVSLMAGAQGGLFLFYGDPVLFALVPLLAGWRWVRGERVLFLDGGNRFNPYHLVDLAKKIGRDPKMFLASVFVSRAFTCHQMAALICRQLPAGMARYRPRLVILASPLETFYDEAVPLIEAKNLLHRSLARLQQTARAGTLIVILSPLPPPSAKDRADFLARIKRQADRVFFVRHEEGAVRIVPEKQGREAAACMRAPHRQAGAISLQTSGTAPFEKERS